MNPLLATKWRATVQVDEAQLKRLMHGARVSAIRIGPYIIQLDRENTLRVHLTRYDFLTLWNGLQHHEVRAALSVRIEHDAGGRWVEVELRDVDRILAQDSAEANEYETRRAATARRQAALERHAFATAALDAARAQLAAAEAAKSEADREMEAADRAVGAAGG